MADLIEIGIKVNSDAEAATRGLNTLNGAVVNSIKSAERLQKNYALLDNAFNKQKITLEQYAKGIQQTDAAIASLQQKMNASSGSVGNYGQHVNQAKGYTNQFGLVTQQLGYQFGDLAVQVQSGTNFFVAFGQQMTQLAGLGSQLAQTTKMITIFAGLGIAIPVITGILAYMTRAKDKTEETVDVFKKLTDQIKQLGIERAKATDSSFDENLVGTKDRLQELTESYQAAKKVVEEFAEATSAASQSGLAAGSMGQALGAEAMGQALIQIATLDFDFNKEKTAALALIEAEKQLLIYKGQRADAQKRIADQAILELNEQIELNEVILKYGEDSVLVREKQAELDKRAYIAKQLDAKVTGTELSRVLAVYDANVKLAESTRARVALQEEIARLRTEEAEAYAATVEEANKLKDSIGEAYLKALGLSQVSLETGVDKAAEAARLLAERLGISLRQAQKLVELEAKYVPAPNQKRPRARPTNIFIDVPEDEKSSSRDALADLLKRVELEKELLGTSEAYQEVLRAIHGSDKQYSEAAIQGAVARVEALNKEKELLETMESQHKQIADVLKSSMESAFMSIVDGTTSAKDAFSSMAASIIKELYRVLVVQQMVGSFQSGGGGILGALAPVFGRASGGTVMSNTPYLVGERGPEIIVPQNRGHVMNADLTAKAMGNGGGSIVVNNNINVTGGSDPAAIRMEVAKLMPQITSATKSAVIDARKRGGQMRAAFQ